jgi:drug/metabolite transporter (DMT)-like permease
MQLLVLVAVFAWSASTVYIRNVHSKLDVLPFTAIQMLLGGVMMTAIAFAKGEAALWQWSKPGLVAMGYLTLLSSCLAYTAFAWLARNTTPALVGTYSYVNPAIAALLGWWFLNERLGVNQLAGMAVMFAGVALVSWPKKDVKRLAEDEQKDPSTAGCG